jgi:hypothetical protein
MAHRPRARRQGCDLNFFPDLLLLMWLSRQPRKAASPAAPVLMPARLSEPGDPEPLSPAPEVNDMHSKLLAVVSAAIVGGLASMAAPPPAQAASGRQAMAQCVSRVLTQLARRRAPESQVGSAVISRCDRQLRASLAESIRSGEASNCTVESCLDVARSRAAAEAIGAYRQRAGR